MSDKDAAPCALWVLVFTELINPGFHRGARSAFRSATADPGGGCTRAAVGARSGNWAGVSACPPVTLVVQLLLSLCGAEGSLHESLVLMAE